MARQTSVIEVNKFVAGLITEATPLNFPDNASISENNFVLNVDGSRQRRLGMDFEDNYQPVITSVVPSPNADVSITSARWRNAGGDPSKNLIAVQVGNELHIFDMDSRPLSAGRIFFKTYNEASTSKPFSYAVVDGTMTVATGLKYIDTFSYSPAEGVTVSSGFLLVRDLFGVEDIVDGVDLRQGSGVSVRPSSLTDTHLYNLRNQTWAYPRKEFHNPGITGDPIDYFKVTEPNGLYPSNSDSVVNSLYANAAHTDPVVLMFNPESMIVNAVGNFPAPQGFFIIDAMARGTSRLSEYHKLVEQKPLLTHNISSLPADTTPGGPSVVGEYSGRVWYGGFSGQTEDGDEHSPRMSSYVLFSQLVNDPSDTLSCYQDGDPTGPDTPDLIDTDGGFIRIEGAYGIVGMVNVGKGLMIIANNGVWQVTGGSDYGFKATDYLINKLTNHGCESPGSIAVVDNSFFYWGDDGIYSVAPNQFGDYVAENIAKKTIQTFYDNIDALDKIAAKGIYDSYERKVRWVYGNRLSSGTEVKELVLDIALSAFYPSTIGNIDSSHLPRVICGVQVPPYVVSKVDDAVTVNAGVVTVSGETVTVEVERQTSDTKETLYIVLSSVSPSIRFSFGRYQNTNFKDWYKVDGVGVDARAFLLTGWMAGGDYQRIKQIPYITFHLNKTENGFTTDSEGDLIPVNQSSCLVQAQWDWTNSANSNRWGKQFQAYRFKRHYIPAEASDSFNNGNLTVVTRNKLRGKGRVLSLLIETEPDKDCQLLGWSMMMEMNPSV